MVKTAIIRIEAHFLFEDIIRHISASNSIQLAQGRHKHPSSSMAYGRNPQLVTYMSFRDVNISLQRTLTRWLFPANPDRSTVSLDSSASGNCQ